jgi:hypothetical protein
VYDDFGQPLGAFMHAGEGVWAEQADGLRFDELLTTLGIRNRAQVKSVVGR